MSDYQIDYVPAEAGPCPVCGEANCKGESGYHGAINIEPRKRKDPRATFRVPHRVYEDGKLLYAKGESITPAEAKRLGLMPDTEKPKEE